MSLAKPSFDDHEMQIALAVEQDLFEGYCTASSAIFDPLTGENSSTGFRWPVWRLAMSLVAAYVIAAAAFGAL